MADKGQKPRELEELSIEELREKIKEDKKNAKRSTAFAAAALIAIIALCIAWFVANHIVTGTSSSVSAKSDVLYRLASVGSRQSAEESYLKLQEGTSKELDSYIDLDTGKPVETKQTYHIGEASLAWYLSAQESFQPGASGKLEFYIIPTHSGTSSLDVQYNMDAYKAEGSKAVRIENEKLQNLVKGHVLLFQKLSNKTGYSGWIKDGKVKVNAPEGTTFEADKAYKVTVYWVWPKYFRNYIYHSRDLYGDLCVSDGEDHTALVKFAENEKSKDNSALFNDKLDITESINSSMSDKTLDTCSESYNLADEYIGENTKYLYLQAVVK